ncbi:MAG TPA: MoaD/ThiS family protein [Calditerricola sp.]
MTIRVQLFAELAERAGQNELILSIPHGARVADVLDAASRACPALADLLPRCAVSVNLAYVPPTHPVGPNDEIAILPPVSGG